MTVTADHAAIATHALFDYDDDDHDADYRQQQSEYHCRCSALLLLLVHVQVRVHVFVYHAVLLPVDLNEMNDYFSAHCGQGHYHV
jgi:uncharacterized protein YqhQ